MGDIVNPTGNVSIYGGDNPSDRSKAVTVTTDGSKERLDVDAKLSLSVPSGENISGLVKLGYVYSFAKAVNMASSGVANPLVLIKNPSGSGKDFYLYIVRFGVNVENNYANFVTWINPTITANGTSYTPVNRYIGGGFGASSMEVYTLPTISANGTEISNLEVAQNANSIEAFTNFNIILRPNNNLLITGDPKSNNRVAVLTVIWAEF